MSIHYVPARRPPTPDIMADVLSAKTAPELIDVLRIKTNGGTQMRAGLNAETVGEYMQTLKDSDQAWPFPPVIVFFDGTDYWLADGFHRVAAMRQLERTDEIPADVRVGDRRAAVLYAAGANAVHGLRRTNADKRRAVEVLLRDEEWAAWSDHEIARRCVVDPKTVGNIRKELAASMEIPQMPTERTVSRGGQTYTQNVSNIGGSQPQYVPAWKLHSLVYEFTRQHMWNSEMLRDAARNQRNDPHFLVLEAALTVEYRRADLVKVLDALADEEEAQAIARQQEAEWIDLPLQPTNKDLGYKVQWKPGGEGWRVVAPDGTIAQSGLNSLPQSIALIHQLAAQLEEKAPGTSEACAPQTQPVYVTVAQLEDVVRATATHWYRAYDAHYAYRDMRSSAKIHSAGPFWRACMRTMRADFGEWREADLAQAINNVVSQMEAQQPATTQAEVFAPNGASRPASQLASLRPAHEDDVYAILEKMAPTCDLATADPAWRLDYVESALLRLDMTMRRDLIEDCIADWLRARQLRHGIEDCPADGEAERQAAEEIDPWTAALATSGSRQQRAELLAEALQPWIREYRDDYGRTWRDLARGGNPSHTNSTFWRDITAEARRRSITAIQDDLWKFAIKQAFAWMTANEPSETAGGAAVTQEADDGKLLVAWTQRRERADANREAAAEPQPEPAPTPQVDESHTLAAERKARLLAVKRQLTAALAILPEFGDLTGRHTASLMAKRELANLIEILDSEMDALEKGVRGV